MTPALRELAGRVFSWHDARSALAREGESASPVLIAVADRELEAATLELARWAYIAEERAEVLAQLRRSA